MEAEKTESCLLQPKPYVLDKNLPPRKMCQQLNDIEASLQKPSAGTSWIEQYVERSSKKIGKKLAKTTKKAAIGLYLLTDDIATEAAKEAYELSQRQQLLIADVRYAHEPLKTILEEQPTKVLQETDETFDKVEEQLETDPESDAAGDLVRDVYNTGVQTITLLAKGAVMAAKTAATSGALDVGIDLANRYNKMGQHIEQNIGAQYTSVGRAAGWYLLASAVPSMLTYLDVVSPTAAAGTIASLTLAKQTINLITMAAATKEKKLPQTELRLLIGQFDRLMKSVNLTKADISRILGRAVVGATCRTWQTENAPDTFRSLPDKFCLPMLYFLNYAHLAYCIDPPTTADDQRDCLNRWSEISKRSRVVETFNSAQGDIGTLTYFTVFDLQLASYVVSLQGTSTLDDVLIDVLGTPTPYTIADPVTKANISGLVHEQMLAVARNIAKQTVAKLEQEGTAGNSFARQFPVICTGHSLGAGVAVLLASELRKEGYTAFAVGIATPAVTSPNLAKAMQSYCVSVINETDIVPRLSERALCNLSSDRAICNRIEYEKSLVCPGIVYWMRSKNGEKKELTSATNSFTQSIIINMSALPDHGVNKYLSSLQTIHPTSPYDAPNINLHGVLSGFPKRNTNELLLQILPRPLKQDLEEREQRFQTMIASLEEENNALEAQLARLESDLLKACDDNTEQVYKQLRQQCIDRHNKFQEKLRQQINARCEAAMAEQKRRLEQQANKQIEDLKSRYEQSLVEVKTANATLRERFAKDRAALEEVHNERIAAMQRGNAVLRRRMEECEAK